ncbi:hypothetical protein PVAP13_9NG753431 [Panicum virgatum]|uniref:Uncharacterized protein n=1 Tax=Panicum virgatum TaxID=38727 RepID=A0A8T0N2Z8_PANVG|nr:hypothetical protein PVAP13_9NG753431 [Panicum virgatum]
MDREEVTNLLQWLLLLELSKLMFFSSTAQVKSVRNDMKYKYLKNRLAHLKRCAPY